jgi:hypothetical protein
MSLGTIEIGSLTVSRIILGSNPFSGHAHQTSERAQEMLHYYTAARIKEVFRQAEELGINTFCGRTDRHIIRVLMEYRDEGGTIQWIGQTAPEFGTIRRGVDLAIWGGANACYIHGGEMDNLLATEKTEEIPPAIERIKEAGMPVGVAGHEPHVFEWSEQNLDVDFYMCSYYNPTDRSRSPEHVAGKREQYLPGDRAAMVEMIQSLSKPVIHYKVFAAGRNDPKEALTFVAQHLRPQDAVCVGVFTKDNPNMLTEDFHLLEEALRQVQAAPEARG